MKRLLLLLLVISYSTIGKCQLKLTELEANIFESYEIDSTQLDFFAGLMAIDSTMTTKKIERYRAELNARLDKFPAFETKENKEKKRVKTIYRSLHNEYFLKYEFISNFNEIFKNGRFNCVSATAFYAYSFNYLNIPFVVKEAPSHVYLIAYPETFKMYIETTVPGMQSFYVLNETEITKIVDDLVKYKMATQQEVNAKGVVQFYEDYYFGEGHSSTASLIGMQYFNSAVTGYEEKDYQRAYRDINKAEVFYKSAIQNSLKKAIYISRLNDLNFDKIEDVKDLVKVLSFTEFGVEITRDNLVYFFRKIFNNSEVGLDYIEKVAQEFLVVEDQEAKTTALELLYEYISTTAAQGDNYDLALEYADSLLNVNSKSNQARKIIEHAIYYKAWSSNFSESGMSEFDSLCEKYDFFKTKEKYKSMQGTFYSNIANEYFSLENNKKGYQYFELLDESLDSNDILDKLNKGLVANVYINAAIYQGIRGYHKKGVAILEKGIQHVPDSKRLKETIKVAQEGF